MREVKGTEQSTGRRNGGTLSNETKRARTRLAGDACTVSRLRWKLEVERARTRPGATRVALPLEMAEPTAAKARFKTSTTEFAK